MNAKRHGPRLWWAALPLTAVAAALLLCSSCRPPTATTPIVVIPPAATPGAPFFVDVTKESGINHTFRNGQTVMVGMDKDLKPIGHFAILESLGGGAGLIDFDKDGRLDVFLPGGGTYTGPDKRQIVGEPCKMYRNLGGFKFQDVTKEVGLDKIDFYTIGVAVADYNRDGWPDLLVTGWGRLALFRNDPVDAKDPSKGRKFTDVTEAAGLKDTSWSSSAAWADLDGDGWPDLYVCHYVNWHFGKDKDEDKKYNPECTYNGKDRDVCPPKQFTALPHVLYRSNGDGTFTDVSKSAGLRVPRAPEDYEPLRKDYEEEALTSGRAAREAPRQFKAEVVKGLLESKAPPTKEDREAAEQQAQKKLEALSKQDLEGLIAKWARQTADDACKRLRGADAGKDYGKGLGVVIADINGDGRPDVYVANDTVDNFLYVNRSRPGKILLEEVGLGAGVARDDVGSANGSMGVDVADYDGSLRASIWCVNYENEKHALYHNDCIGDRTVFRYTTSGAGINTIGQNYVGWGTRFVDFDLDGIDDLFISNGHAIRFPQGKSTRLQKPLLMQGYEKSTEKGPPIRKFKDMTAAQGGDYCQKEHCGRGVAFGDLDNRGRTDLVLAHLEEPTTVLKTVAGEGNHWIGFDVRRKEHRDPVGTKVILEANGRKQARFAKGGGSYASANDPRHVFGLGQDKKIDKLTVTWPGGEEQTWEGLAVDQYWVLTEGDKEAKAAEYPK